jgi:hypothetical protein
MKTSRHIISFIAICSLSLFTAASFAQAASPTPLASIAPSTSASDSVKQNIKERVEKIKQTTDPAVNGLMTSLRSPKFGLIGTLEKIVGSTFQIRNFRGKVHVVEMDKTATLLKNQKTIKREEIELNSPVLVMGYRENDDLYLTRRLVITDDATMPSTNVTLLGKFISSTTKGIKMQTRINNELTDYDMKISAKTSFLNTLNSAIKRTELKENDMLVAILPDNQSSSSAIRVYSLSSRAIPTPSPIDEKLLKQ